MLRGAFARLAIEGFGHCARIARRNTQERE
jgi:hypothetical protein